jgi:hypothetical protein
VAITGPFPTFQPSLGGNIMFDKFENAPDVSWVKTGSDIWAYVNEARGTGSSYFWRHTSVSVGDRQTWTGTDATVTYTEFWFRVQSTTGFDTTEWMDIFRLSSATGFTVISLRVTNTEGQYTLIPVDHVSSNYGTPQNISLDVWYHVGIYWDNTLNVSSWYLSTTDALGSAVSSASPSTSRSVGIVAIGRILISGTIGSCNIDYDSLSIDNAAFTPIEKSI